ncbi:MAG: HEAT repeat domain-containing protein [Acidimicrobiia bacterium]
MGQRRRLPRTAADELATAAATDPDGRVRAAALGALVRAGAAGRARDVWHQAVDDPDPAVRRRAANLAPTLAGRGAPDALVDPLTALLADPDVTVVEAAAFALGELDAAVVHADAVSTLATTVIEHCDPIAREAAVAALGALGQPAGLPAVLAACNDKPAVRRRAVLALAPFSGPEVDAALAAAMNDKDWQVRQAAEDLLDES